MSRSGEVKALGDELRAAVGAFMARASWDAAGREADDARFNELALRVFRYQTVAVPVYGQFVANRGIDPHSVHDWHHIPPVPARAFRRFPLVAGGEGEPVEAVFRTSGTSGGEATRGVHRVLDLSLYRASLLPTATRHLNPQGESLRVLALAPAPRDRPDSSLVHMVGVFHEVWDDGGGGFFADGQWQLRTLELLSALEDAEASGVPVLMAGTAFGYVHLLDLLAQEGRTVCLPPGSRLMETGGFKGRSREVARETLYGDLERRLGIPIRRMVNEYGMTELLSQFWETPLADPPGPDHDDLSRRSLVGPPWIRTRILDPHRLTPVPPGEVGLLQHLDLANLHAVSALLTEDQGVAVTRRRFRVLGRRPGAEPRGCSLSMEELALARSQGAGGVRDGAPVRTGGEAGNA
ncbi:MAG: hypothetical protein EA422_11095 [Gemmatimonadales bacterium]|nr:MAG: hypothetical protein EA422_11095 [Gemmatimonadales bacterium]